MIVTAYNPEDMGDIYKAIFFRSFGFYVEHRTPDAVMLVEEKDRSILYAFASLFEKSKQEVYICYGGAIRRGPRAIVSMRLVVEELHKTYPYITLNVENSNVAMLKLALHVGFLIIGTRVAVDGTTIVELMRGRQ